MLGLTYALAIFHISTHSNADCGLSYLGWVRVYYVRHGLNSQTSKPLIYRAASSKTSTYVLL